MESAKRLGPDGKRHKETHYFELLSPSTNDTIEYAIPHHVYILGAMNQADTSVEPLDVAFLRRWAPFRLEPDRDVLMKYFGLTTFPTPLPDEPKTSSDVYAAAISAWAAVNDRIALGRGPEFRIGHGVLMSSGASSTDLAGALRRMSEAWRVIRAHVDEVFFGDVRGVATVLGVGLANKKSVGEPKHPYSLEDRSFADEPRVALVGPDPITDDQLYSLLRAVAAK